MQITIDIKDQNIISSLKEEFQTQDLSIAIDKLLHRFKYKDEYKLANDILTSFHDVKKGNTRDIKELLNEL